MSVGFTKFRILICRCFWNVIRGALKMRERLYLPLLCWELASARALKMGGEKSLFSPALGEAGEAALATWAVPSWRGLAAVGSPQSMAPRLQPQPQEGDGTCAGMSG